jgi:hypothetical protein
MPIALYRVKRPGDLLLLDEYLESVDRGFYVLLSIGDRCCLARAGENAAGEVCTTNELIDIAIPYLSLFKDLAVQIEPLKLS